MVHKIEKNKLVNDLNFHGEGLRGHEYKIHKENEKEKNKNKKQNQSFREGDWICPECQNMNFSFRLDCNKCSFSKGGQ